MTAESLTYLFAAYTAVWVVLVAYLWRLSRRLQQLHRELEELRSEERHERATDTAPAQERVARGTGGAP